ncbi:MAG: hypothetical protein K1X89_21400 [Myxococcaceae bacterium]|nr:hypothetical protein [Myxococcaceae bacterium]
MKLTHLGQRFSVTDADLLGEGGEAKVFRWKDLAVKVFHPVRRGTPEEALRAQKLLKLSRFPRGLPGAVVAPVGPVEDEHGQVVGYAMPAIAGARELSALVSRASGVSAEHTRALFSALHAVMTELHALQVVVGDCNDGNLLFQGEQPYLIDADSMQLGGLPCPVGHERFLDPRLYGVDLAAAPRFDEGSDWYAFAVLLFQSWLGVHPYGGVHGRLPTLLRRAEAAHSVLKADVRLPPRAWHWKVLPDEALGYFEAVFDRRERAPVPPALLAVRWSRCACGQEHARAVRARRDALGPLAARPVLRSKGRCTVRSLFRTDGRLLAAANQGGARWVVEEGGQVKREDGALVLDGPADAGTRFFIAGASTWVADGRGRLTRVKDGQVELRASTGLRGGEPIFAASTSAAWRAEGEKLVDELTGARVGQVLEGNTWLFAGERLGFGFYRAGGFTHAFVLTPGRAGLKPVALPHLEGKVVDAAVAFDARHALFSVRTALDGRETVARFLIDEHGAVLAQASGQSGRRFEACSGAAVLGGRVVLATSDGLLLLKAEAGQLVEGTLFPDAAELAAATDTLFPQPDGALWVVGPRELDHLQLS